MADADSEKIKYVKDTRIACKYGVKCYQRNPAHLEKYKHPPKNKDEDSGVKHMAKKRKVEANHDKLKETVEIRCKPSDTEEHNDKNSEIELKGNISNCLDGFDEVSSSSQTSSQDNKTKVDLGRTPKTFDVKEFVKTKFLLEMPNDFYDFWDFCKEVKEKSPQYALKDVGLTLVGPYDVLAGKFFDIEDKPPEAYLLHWRYFYDPPELQTVLRGDDKTGYHIGYFRDSPDQPPVFLANNYANKDGILTSMGENIYAAVNIFLENLKKTGDPFKKMHINRIQVALKKKAEQLGMDLSERTPNMVSREKKIVTRTFNKIGLVVPYNRKTQLGYRQISVGNKELVDILNKLQKALPEQRSRFLSDLQPVLTNASIAADECDFGTGIELGLNILAHGIESLNSTISGLLASNYRLIKRETFASIAEAHMKNRRKGCNLDMLSK